MSVTISVLCFNRLGYTQRCLDSLLRYSPGDVQIIVTDNGSSDGTWDYLCGLEEEDDRIELVRNKENLGLTRPKNHALSLARHPYFVSFDNDAVVDGRGWLDAMRGELDHAAPVAQVGWKAPHVSCALGFGGVGYPSDNIEYIEGSVMMIRTAVARQVGGVCDPVYPFAYCEDADLSLKLRQRGYQIRLVELPVSHPPEAEKQAHGGVNLEAHHRMQHMIFNRRWRVYLRTRSFAFPVCLLARSDSARGRAMRLVPYLEEQMPKATISIGPRVPFHAALGYSVDVAGTPGPAALRQLVNTTLPVHLPESVEVELQAALT